MARKIDKILVGENSSEKQISEIIQVGLVILNTEVLRELGRSSYLIKPRYSKISEFCTKLTGITSEDIKSTNYDFPFKRIWGNKYVWSGTLFTRNVFRAN